MKKVIKRAAKLILEVLQSSPKMFNSIDACPTLMYTLIHLTKLLEMDSSETHEILLFCRQLNRMMDYNDKLPVEFWTELHKDIPYVLEGSNDELDRISWKQFVGRMKLELALEQRELQFYERFRERKSLQSILDEHQTFFERYFEKCVSLHSKVKVQGLIDSTDNFLRKVFGLTELSLDSDNQKRLKKKLECIEITLDSGNSSFQCIDSRCFAQDNSNKRVSNKHVSSFLPSQEQTKRTIWGHCMKIEDILQSNRWIVILGDPGSAKTTLLRWITCIFADAALRRLEKVQFKKNDHSSTCVLLRIPILIQIGEFQTWLDKHQTKTLIDYIGEHSWSSESDYHDGDGCGLRELIYHGHALILLDGLDEITELKRKSAIVKIVKQFIDEYVRSSDFVSGFDDQLFNNVNLLCVKKIVETSSLSESGGNQIVITSRNVGYQLCPLIGPFIQHYLLSPMSHEQANEFATNWMSQVETSIFDVLVNEKINLDKKMFETLSKERNDALQAMFNSDSKLLMSNPSLLSLICTSIFEAYNEFQPKCRVQVYNEVVRKVLRSWSSQKASISEDMILDLLISFAVYLHLQSPSGLIDKFDMKQLCCFILRQQGVTNDREQLRKYARELIPLLQLNIGVVGERGLEVFGFLHLLFQEYFVGQAFVRRSSVDVDAVVKCILSWTINPRFREPLLLALGWISWKWSFDDYNKLCNLLVRSNTDYAIPLGTLLLFDAFNDLHILPSKTVLFTALNTLLDHSSNIVKDKYLIWSLSKLSEDLIKEWMQTYLKDDKCLFKFCQSFPMENSKNRFENRTVATAISPVIYQQLWSLHGKSTSIEFLIDQTLRRTIRENDVNYQIFNHDIASYFLSNDMNVCKIHPLIASVIIAVCGGLHLRNDKHVSKIDFSSKQMHRESAVLSPIVKYLVNNTESHSVKVQTLIKQYQNTLRQSLPSNTSVDIVDTFIALICLKGVSQPFSFQKFGEYEALPLALDRLKHVWFYFKKLFCTQYALNMNHLKSEVDSIMNVFFLQIDQSNEQRMAFSLACEDVWKKLGLWDLLGHIKSERMFGKKPGHYYLHQPSFIHLINKNKLKKIAKNIRSLHMLPQKSSVWVKFLPQFLQKLYCCTTISPTNDRDAIPFVVLLSECLLHLEDVDKDNLNLCLVFPILYPLLKEHHLENYALVQFQEKYSENQLSDKDYKRFIKAMKNHQLLVSYAVKQPDDWKLLINTERERISELNNTSPSQEKKDAQLFAASLSLARLFQAQYRYKISNALEEISFSPDENKQVHSIMIKIVDPVLRIIATSIILDMEDPSVFDEEQTDQFRLEMINLLKNSLPNLSLLQSTLLFVRCHTVQKFFPEHFRCMASIIGTKLNETSTNKSNQEAAYIALLQLNNSDLSLYLSEYAKGAKNLSNLLQLKSSFVFPYFTKNISFDSLNTILISSMYLTELAFDAQIINIYTKSVHSNNVLPLNESTRLWKNSPKKNKMTFEVARSITIYLQTSNKEELRLVIKDVSQCVVIERKALLVIEQWLDYQKDEVLNFFAYYAAFQLFIKGSTISDLISIINEMFNNDKQFRWKYIVRHLFNSQVNDLSAIRQILVLLHRNVQYFSKISVWIDYRHIFEIIRDLEIERVTSNPHKLDKSSTKSFLFMIKGCSRDLQLCLVDHLRALIDKHRGIENDITKIYIPVVIKWSIENSIEIKIKKHFSMKLYDYIFVLLYDQQFPQVQKAIVNGLSTVFSDKYSISKKNIFLQDSAIINLESVISLWKTYSEDIIALCLLAYGNCILKLKKFQMNRNVSNELKEILKILFNGSSSSEIISIRAGFCLNFLNNSDTYSYRESYWFGDKSSITIEKKYKILLQQTLYTDANHRDIVDPIKTYFDEIIDTFVIDFYNYLCDTDKTSYVCDPTPAYIIIAATLLHTKPNEFCKAIQKCSFGENGFIRQLCSYCKNNQRDIIAPTMLCSAFGTLTIEVLDMLECADYASYFHIPQSVKDLKNVYDRDVIEKVLNLLYLTTSKDKFKTYSDLLRSLVEANVVSLLEVHQKSSWINCASFDDDDNSTRWSSKENILDLLLNFSCIEKRSWNSENELFNESDINEEFEREKMRFLTETHLCF